MRPSPHPPGGLTHGGQGRCGVLGHRDVVEADHGDVVRHRPPGRPQSPQHARRADVVVREDRVELCAGGEELFHGQPAAAFGEVPVDDEIGGQDRAESVQPVAYAAEVPGARDDQGSAAPGGQQMTGGGRPSFAIGGHDGGELGVVAAVVDQHDRQTVAVQRGEMVEGVLGLDDQEPVEGARRHLAGEAPYGLGAAIAGEEQQPVIGGLDGVHDTLEHLAHPRPGERGHQHGDRTAAAAGQSDGTRAGYVAELCDHFTNAGGSGTVHLTLGVDDP